MTMIGVLVAVGLGIVFVACSLAIGWGLAAGIARPRSRVPKVDYDKMNRLEFELGIPFSSRPEPWHPPDVTGSHGYYNVVCRDCGYRSTGHLTEAGAQERADSHHREHLTGEMADG